MDDKPGVSWYLLGLLIMAVVGFAMGFLVGLLLT